MCRKHDLEVRCYITGVENGDLEWAVVLVEADGQTRWIDSDVPRWKPGTPLLPSRLGRAVSLATRMAVGAAYRLSVVAGDAESPRSHPG